MKCQIDHHILRIFDVCGYKSYHTLKKITNESINSMECFIKGDGLLTRIDEADLQLYLGPVKHRHHFCFQPGERELILSIAEFVKQNFAEPKVALGKVSIYPLFKKRPSSNSTMSGGHASEEPATKKKAVDTVVCFDTPKEIMKIKKLINDYCSKKDFPKEVIKALPRLQVEIKTVELVENCAGNNSESKQSATMSAKVSCPFCKKYQTCTYNRAGYWITSNMHRHLKQHVSNGDIKNQTHLSRSLTCSNSQYEEEDSELVDGQLSEILSQSSQTSNVNVESKEQPGSETIGENISVDEAQSENFKPGSSQTTNVESEEQSDREAVGENISVNGSQSENIQPQSSPTFNVESLEQSGNINSLQSGAPKTSLKQAAKESNSRDHRRKMALGKHIEGQSRITCYFPVLNEIEITLKSNQDMIDSLTARCDELSFGKSSSGERYEEDVKLFSLYLFIVGGRGLYEFLRANLPKSLPCISTLERALKESSKPIIEGVFRFQELKEFLVANNLPLKVSISEDGTRIQERFCYDPYTNCIVGPVLPLAHNGVPLTNTFPATSAAMIANHFKNGKVAGTGYAFMAQPLKDGAPTFCLCLFGTDNKFNKDQVYKRWTFIYEELKKIDIEVVSFSSDGDSKLLSAMHSHMFTKKFGVFKEEWSDWFFASARQDFSVMQDPVHTINKFRNRLSPPHDLFIGKYVASQTHLRSLIDNIDKSEHGLTKHDLDKEDKMNFDASKKICRERVTEQLQSNVPSSNGTVLYLTCMRYLMEGCLDSNLSPAEKIYKVWYCAYFLRYWKNWLLCHPNYKISENFVTSNLYMCVEVIAHSLVKLVVKFRESDLPMYFLFHLYSSQPCEMFFRLARSMTTTQSTVINFSMKDFLEKVRRIDILQYCTCKLANKLEFPKEKRKKLLGILTQEKLEASYLPSDNEIRDIVMAAKAEIISELNNCGMKISQTTSLVRIKSYLESTLDIEDENRFNADDPVNYQADINEDDIPLNILAAFPSPSPPSLDPFSDAVDSTLPAHSIFVKISNSNSDFTKMKKSTFCWLLVNNGIKLSTKRLEKVRQNVSFSLSNNSVLQPRLSLEPLQKSEVTAGDWCIFKNPAKRSPNFFIVQILGFTYLTSGPGCSRSYTLPTAPIHPPAGSQRRGIGCLCDRFRCKDEKLLEVHVSVQTYIDICQYVATIPHPIVRDSNLITNTAVIEYLKNLET
ncbi:30S ribosomal protein S4E [Frankliniella fusca]|uniref:30S ribosomal protein S4E n=1 Tax=Frankliniella fusca TaxID=407009 RepID=A0AAE1GY52_9NEOP|nr:30S ribosomal protein S4E [Frankliniella fusca]